MIGHNKSSTLNGDILPEELKNAEKVASLKAPKSTDQFQVFIPITLSNSSNAKAFVEKESLI